MDRDYEESRAVRVVGNVGKEAELARLLKEATTTEQMAREVAMGSAEAADGLLGPVPENNEGASGNPPASSFAAELYASLGRIRRDLDKAAANNRRIINALGK